MQRHQFSGIHIVWRQVPGIVHRHWAAQRSVYQPVVNVLFRRFSFPTRSRVFIIACDYGFFRRGPAYRLR